MLMTFDQPDVTEGVREAYIRSTCFVIVCNSQEVHVRTHLSLALKVCICELQNKSDSRDVADGIIAMHRTMK